MRTVCHGPDVVAVRHRWPLHMCRQSYDQGSANHDEGDTKHYDQGSTTHDRDDTGDNSHDEGSRNHFDEGSHRRLHGGAGQPSGGHE